MRLQAELIHIAASLAKGRYFSRILKLCENQKSISTRKLQWIIEEAEESQKLDAQLLSKAVNLLNEKDKQIKKLEKALSK